VEYSKVRNEYTIKNYKTESCGNLYSFCSERSYKLNKLYGNIGLIIPLSIVAGNKFWALRDLFNNKYLTYYSYYDIRPAKLFDGVDQRLTIILNIYGNFNEQFTTKYIRWETTVRKYLFNNLRYTRFYDNKNLGFAKLGNEIEKEILKKLSRNKSTFENYSSNSGKNCFYFRSAGGRYYLSFFNSPQKTIINNIETNVTAEKPFYLNKDFNANIATSVLSSTIFYIYFIFYSDARNLTIQLIKNFPINNEIIKDESLNKICKELMISLKSNSVKTQMIKKNGDKIILWEIHPSASKPIIDEIDTVLAEHYGFTEEELDFIINYDIKYRMGKQNEEDE
jgi:hypothetical protein